MTDSAQRMVSDYLAAVDSAADSQSGTAGGRGGRLLAASSGEEQSRGLSLGADLVLKRRPRYWMTGNEPRLRGDRSSIT